MAPVLDTEYVYMEMIRDKGGQDYEVIGGLFKGLYEKDGDKYVLLHGLKECTEALLFGAYDIMTIEVLEKDFRNMTFCTKEASDQEQAFKIVEGLFEDLKENGFEVKDHAGFLDVSKYTSVPKEYGEGKFLATGNTNAKGSFSDRRKHYSPNATGTIYSKTTPKAKPEPAAFSRTKTTKPTADDLTALSTLLDQVLAGDAELLLPPTPGDDPQETVAACERDEETFDHYGWGG